MIKTTDLVLETFERSSTEVKDGMDISFISYNKSSRDIHWSGANNPLLYISNGELIEIKPDKQPIGKHDNRKPFTTNKINYFQNSMFYLFTDGLSDQFGGVKGKKFMQRKLKEILVGNCNLEMEEQKKILKKEFLDWKGNLDQVDDITVLGIKI